MNLSIWKKLGSAYLLLPIIALAFYITFIPHQGYAYPVHIDEWVHLAFSEAILETGSTTFTDPFLGQSVIGFGSPHLEAGYHLFWGIFHQISGISWLTIFRYFPGVIFIITILSVYILGQRQGFGWEAAFFTSLILTTVGIMGPAFLVPVAMGLLFIPLSLFIAYNFKGLRAYIVLFIFTCFLLTIHAPSAICSVLIIFPYVILNLKGNFKHSLGVALSVLIPFLAPFPWIFKMLLPTARELFTQQPLPTYVDFPTMVQAYGYVPIAICLLGTFLLVIKASKRNLGLILGFLTLLLMLTTFYTFHYGISIMYERGLMFMMLMVGIVAGAGLAGVKNLNLPVKFVNLLKKPLLTRHVGKLLCLVLVTVTLVIGIPYRQDIPYYYMIGDEDYQVFAWIDQNVAKEYEKAILDPWKATAFTAVTGRSVYSRIHAYPKASDEEAYQFLGDGSSNTTFLRENGISIVYTDIEVNNPELTEIRENVYLLPKTDIP
ncbi:hypothetical protein ACFLXG_03300 [Chloroflexota bacterium]